MMTQEWVKENNAQKVIYLDDTGPIHEAMTALFNIGYLDLQARIKHPDDDMWNMSYTNKNMSSFIGAHLWVNLLQLYEYFEPIKNAYQQEWRIVQNNPLYGYKETKQEIIGNVSPPKGWASVVNVIKIHPNDIAGFVCPKDDEAIFIKRLPPSYAAFSIDTF
jgi:hypothetical protein